MQTKEHMVLIVNSIVAELKLFILGSGSNFDHNFGSGSNFDNNFGSGSGSSSSHKLALKTVLAASKLTAENVY